MNSTKKVYIAHTEDVKDWVHELAKWLAGEERRIEVVAALYDLRPGMETIGFAEQMQNPEIDKVLLICTATFLDPTGQEETLQKAIQQLSKSKIYKDPTQTRYIPVAFEADGAGNPLLPPYLSTRVCIDLSTADRYQEEAFRKLLNAILDINTYEKPIVGFPAASPVIQQQWYKNTDRSQHQYRKELNLDLPKLRLADFIGRGEDLEAIRQYLNSNQQVVVVNGMGGLGKTAVAEAYVTRYYNKYEYILWVTLNASKAEGEHLPTENALENDFINTAGLLGVFEIEQKERTAQELFTKILSGLQNIKHAPSLLVLDNATSEIDNNFKLLPKYPNWHLLATSRDQLTQFTVHQLDFLSLADAKKLFKEYCPSNKFSDTFLEALVQQIGHHTLLIKILAITSENSQEYDEDRLLNILSSNDLVLDIDKNKQLPVEQLLTNIFKSQLANISPLQRHLLVNFACLPAKPQPYEILKKLLSLDISYIPPAKKGLLESLFSLFKPSSPKQKVDKPLPTDLSIELNKLCQKSWLIKENTDGQTPLYRMHRLVATVVWNVLYEEKQEQVEALLSTLIPLIGIIDDTKEDKFSWLPYGEHLMTKVKDISVKGKAVPDTKKHLSESDQVRVCQALFDLYFHLGQYNAAKPMIEQVRILNKKEFGVNYKLSIQNNYQLAVVLRHLGDLQQAQKIILEVIAIKENTLGNDHQSTLSSKHLLASILQQLGQWQQAQKIILEVIAIEENTLGNDHQSTLISKHLLASILQQLGQWQQAQKIILEVIAIEENTLGNDHQSTLISKHLLASILLQLGQTQKAEKIIRQVITIQENTLGKDHPNTLPSKHLLASILLQLGQTQKAEKIIRQVITIQENTLGKDHPNTLSSKHLLAAILQDLGQTQKAEKTILQVITIQENTLGKDHPNTLPSKHLLANILQDLGQTQKAEKIILQVITIQENTLGKDHPNTARSYYLLARILQDLGNHIEAKEFLEKAIAIQEKVWGMMHYKLAESYHELALVDKALKTSHWL